MGETTVDERFFFSSRRRHTRLQGDWSSDVCSSDLISAVQKMNQATNWEEFRDALRDWDVPPQNLIYGDKKGNIGYVMAGAIPIRAKGQALLPSPGWTGEYEWTGFIPFDELPQTYNPERHFIVTAKDRKSTRLN